MTIVIDASVAVAWLLPEQATASADFLLEQLPALKAVAPNIFSWEVANQMLNRERRNVGFDPIAALEQLQGYGILLAPALDMTGFDQVLELAQADHLSLFDAAYLHLAIVSEASLASRDRRRLTAAQRRGVGIRDITN